MYRHGIKCFLLAAAVAAAAMVTTGCAARHHSTAGQVSTQLCEKNTFLKKYRCSLTNLERSASSGNADAQYGLGYMYFYGIATIRDTEAATLWIDRAAAQGQPLAKRAQALLNHAKSRYMQARRAKVVKQKRATAAFSSGDDDLSLNAFATSGPAAQSAVVHHSVSTHHKAAANRYFTLQLMATPHFKRLVKFIHRYHIADDVNYFAVKHGNQTLYVLLYGKYPSAFAAKQAVKHLPKGIRSMRPWVRSSGAIQRERHAGRTTGER